MLILGFITTPGHPLVLNGWVFHQASLPRWSEGCDLQFVGMCPRGKKYNTENMVPLQLSLGVCKHFLCVIGHRQEPGLLKVGKHFSPRKLFAQSNTDQQAKIVRVANMLTYSQHLTTSTFMRVRQ